MMDVQREIENLQSQIVAIRRLVYDLGRDLGPLRSVTTVADLRIQWPTLAGTDEGVMYLRNWWWRYVAHPDQAVRLSTEDADKIFDAIAKIEHKREAVR